MNKEALTKIYNRGYRAGHEDTVEGNYIDIHAQDMCDTHDDIMEEMIKEDKLLELPNKGRGKCLKVTVVWKLNLTEGVAEVYAVTQNPKVANGIRELFYEEAKKYGIEPKHYVYWKDFVVLWSRSVFPDRYRIFDTDNKKVRWSLKRKDGEYDKYYSASKAAKLFRRSGKLNNYVIQKWNRQRQQWEIVTAGTKLAKIRLAEYNRFTK